MITKHHSPARLLSTSLVVALSVAAVAACGGGGSGGGSGDTLTIAVGPPTSPGEKPFENELVKAFHKATGATLKFDYTITSTQAELQIIDTAAVSNSGPDLVMLGDTISAAAYKSGGFHTLTKSDWATIGGQDKFWPATFGNAGPDKSHDIMVPDYVDPTLMVYNKKLFAKAHITKPPTTWSEFVADAQKVNDPSHGIYGTDFFPNDSQAYKAMWYLGTDYGGTVFSKDLKTAKLTDDAWFKGLQFWFDLYTKYHIVPPKSATNTQAQFASDFASGKIGEEVAATASYEGTYAAGAIGKDFAFAPLPTVPYGQDASAGAPLPTSMDLYEGFVIANSAPQKLALQFLKILTSNKEQLDQFKLGKFMPANITACKGAQKLDPDLITPQISAEEQAAPVPYTPAWSTFQTAIGTVTIDAGAYLATHHNVPDSEFKQLLQKANSTLQQGM